MKIFASELSKCRKVKFIYGVFIVFSLCIIFIVFPILWFFKAPVQKTGIDFVREYVEKRMNYTPDTVEDAYFNEYQSIFPMYKTVVKDEIEFIKKNKIYQMVIVLDINNKLEDKSKYLVYIKRVKFSCIEKDKCKKLYESKMEKIYVRNVGSRKYILEEKKKNG